MRLNGLLLGLVLAAGANSQTASNFVSLTPCRVVDTRDNARGNLGTPYISGNVSRDFPILESTCGVPSTASAYSLNITVVPHEGLGYLTVWPAGMDRPNASTLNSPDGSILANAAIVPAGTNGSISVYASQDTDVVIDINGYFVQAAATVTPDQVNQINQQISQLNQQTAQLAQQSTQLSQQTAQVSASIGTVAPAIATVNSGQTTALVTSPSVSVSQTTGSLIINAGQLASVTPQQAGQTGTIFIYRDPVTGTIDAGSTIALNCTFCSYVPGVTSFPAGATIIASWQISGGSFAANPAYQAGAVGVPVSSTDTCIPGSWADSSTYHYSCVAPNSWRRIALATF